MSVEIILIDDHTLFRNGIKALLSRQSDLEVIGEATDGFAGIKLIEQTRPGIVLPDLDMPVMNGCETLAQILSSNPQRTVVVLTVPEGNDDLAGYMRVSAHGFLLKNINADFLLDSIREAIDGNNAFSPEIATRPVQSLVSPASSHADHLLSTLTPREVRILGYLAAGHSNKVITRYLELAESTIKVHVQNILRELNPNSRMQAIVCAVQHKVPQPEGI